MNVKVTTLPQSQVSLDVEVESEAIGNAIDRAYRQLAQRVNVPGFRRGKAPRAVLEAAIGRGAVLEEAADIAVNDSYREALEQTGLDPISTPEIDLQGNGLDPSQPLFYTAKFYVYPKVELGDYKDIRVEPKKSDITDDEVNEAIRRLAESQAPWEPVEDRPAQDGDVAIIKVKGTVDDETLVDEEEQEHLLSPDDPGEENTLNLTPQILGMNVGEARDFEIVLPQGFQPEQYAGKTMQTHVELVRLEKRAEPEIDDAFAQSLGEGEFSSLDDLRERLRANMQMQKSLSEADAYVSEVTQRVTDQAQVELPPPLVEEEIHRTLDNLKAEVESRQGLTMDLYLRLTGKTMEDLHEEVRGPSEGRVKSNLVLEAIAEAEGIEAPRDQVDAELGEVAALPTVRERDRRRVLTSPAVRARVETRLKRRLALQRLLEIANPPGDSSDTTSGDSAHRDALQQAAESHADALESPTHQSGDNAEEI